MWKQWQTIFWGSKITADDDCNHEIKRCLLLGRKAMTSLDSILKSRDITLPTKVGLVKAMVFPVIMYGYESWTVKKAECQTINVFELWFWRRLLRVPWTARRSNQSILKEISLEYSLEGLMLKLKLQYFGHLMGRTDSFEKTLILGKIEGRWRRRWQRMKWLDGITNLMHMNLSKLRDGQRGLVSCSPCGCKELYMTEWLNWTELQDLKAPLLITILSRVSALVAQPLSRKGWKPRSQVSTQSCEPWFYIVMIKSLPLLFRVINWKIRISNSKDKRGSLRPLLLGDNLLAKYHDPSSPPDVEIILSSLHQKYRLCD